jgi:hypothetical protein
MAYGIRNRTYQFFQSVESESGIISGAVRHYFLSLPGEVLVWEPGD